jgi:hypothetical protein
MQAGNRSASRNPGPHAVVELSTVGSAVPQAVQQHPARFFQQIPSAPGLPEYSTQAGNRSASRNPGPHAVVELSTVGSAVHQAVQQHPARYLYRAIPGARAFPVLPATKRSPLWHHGCEAEIDGMLVWRCAYCE